MKKSYVLEAGILCRYPDALFGFEDNNVHITASTLNEIARTAAGHGDIAENASKSTEIIENIIDESNTTSGARINDKGGALFVHNTGKSRHAFDYEDELLDEISNKADLILVTNKSHLRVKAKSAGIRAEPYRNEQTILDDDYKGWREIIAPDNIIDLMYKERFASADDILDGIDAYNDISNLFLYENEYYHITNGAGHDVLAIYRNGALEKIERNVSVYGITAKNYKQEFLLHALTSKIPLVIVRGPAGTGKTLCALAAGLDAVEHNDSYCNVMITRNHVLTEKGFGAVPGDLHDKMKELMMPYYDALETLLMLRHENRKTVRNKIAHMFETFEIEECPFSYIRGRNISKRYLILDEAQNASPKLIRDFVTRPADGTKVVVCGDISQIDANDLDQYTNGLAFCAEGMKGSPACAQIAFDEDDCIRGFLASEALKRLTINSKKS